MRQVWEGMLTELSKVNAPSMLLLDFNYFFNKAINLYINKRYNIYDINLQTTDDLRVLKATSILDVHPATDSQPLASLVGLGAGKSKLLDATYEVYLPLDYLHILNCICIYKVNKRFKCYNEGDYVLFSAKRLNGDSWSVILNDYYNRPLPERPYFYIHNVNTNIKNSLTPTNPSVFEKVKDANNVTDKILVSGTDLNATDYEKATWLISGTVKGAGVKVYSDEDTKPTDDTAKTKLTNQYTEEHEDTPSDTDVKVISIEKILTSKDGNSNFPRTVLLNLIQNDGTSKKVFSDAVEKSSALRYGNVSSVRMEIRYGHDRSLFELLKVFVDYIKTPQYIRLTQEQVNLTEDTSQIMEFPDYVCLEIINELTNLVMENTADPRLLTHPAITLSIANPAPQLPAPQLRASRQLEQ